MKYEKVIYLKDSNWGQTKGEKATKIMHKQTNSHFSTQSLRTINSSFHKPMQRYTFSGSYLVLFNLKSSDYVFRDTYQLVYSCAHTANSEICSSVYTQVEVIAGSTWQSSTCCTRGRALCALEEEV